MYNTIGDNFGMDFNLPFGLFNYYKRYLRSILLS